MNLLYFHQFLFFFCIITCLLYPPMSHSFACKCYIKDAPTLKAFFVLGMQSHLTSFTLTKMITFTSYFSFHNKSDLDVEISECNGVWWKVDAGKKIDIWPEEKEKFLVARLKGIDDSNSVKFRFVLNLYQKLQR